MFGARADEPGRRSTTAAAPTARRRWIMRCQAKGGARRTRRLIPEKGNPCREHQEDRRTGRGRPDRWRHRHRWLHPGRHLGRLALTLGHGREDDQGGGAHRGLQHQQRWAVLPGDCHRRGRRLRARRDRAPRRHGRPRAHRPTRTETDPWVVPAVDRRGRQGRHPRLPALAVQPGDLLGRHRDQRPRPGRGRVRHRPLPRHHR